MRRITFWLLSTVSVVVLLFGFDASRHGGTPAATTPFVSTPAAGSASGSDSTTTGGSTGSRSSGTTKGTTTPGTRTRGTSGSGQASPTTTTTTTGSAVSTIWGPVQVEILSRGGTITQVKVLEYPNGNPRDVQIADYALPILVDETIKSQSAGIDMVSGATYTSTGYIQSLQSALDRAHL